MTRIDAETKKGIRRTALVLALVAIAFYLGFIMMGVIKS